MKTTLQRSLSDRSSPPARRKRPRRMATLALITLSVALGLLLPANSALAKSKKAKPQPSAERLTGAFCSATASTLLAACQTSTVDDRLVARANCINISDAELRDDCFDEAGQAQKEGNQLCSDQFATRVAACKVLGEGRYDPSIAAALFDDPRTPSRPNPYFPLSLGNRWEFKSQTRVNTVEAVNERKLIDGVLCTVFRDLVFKNGILSEATDDWYAPAKDGSTWYFGEEVKDFEDFAGDDPRREELTSIDGSFKQGRDRSKAGIISLASPKRGDAYLEEFSLGNAEDVTEILSTNYTFGSDAVLDQGVPAGLAQRFCRGDCVVTKNYSLIEPGVFARKYYARDIGVFLEVESEGDVIQLVSCNFDSRCVGLPTP